MAWQELNLTQPVASADGSDVVSKTRDNFNSHAMWTIATTGSLPGYAITTNSDGGAIPDDQPTEVYFRRGAASTTGSIWIRVSLVWGTTGGADGNVTQMTFAFSDNGLLTAYQKMTMHGFDRATFNWTANGDPSPSNFVTWSLS
ncbi:MAG: hypothetical protein ACRDAM_08875 [Casimicrobium sp.]